MKEKITIIIEELFQIALATYLILLVLETIKSGFVSIYFNLQHLLIVVMISGVAFVLLKPRGELTKARNQSLKEFDVYLICVLSLGGGLLTFYKIVELGWYAYIIASVTAILILLLSILIFKGDTDPSTSQ